MFIPILVKMVTSQSMEIIEYNTSANKPSNFPLEH